LPTLIRQCKADRKWEERVDAAETLAYLTEVDIRLQNTTAISDQIITTLNEFFKYPGSPPDASLMPTTKVQMIKDAFSTVLNSISVNFVELQWCERTYVVDIFNGIVIL